VLKIIGALMITTATTSLGVLSVKQLKRRVRSLRTLIGALDIMRSEICTRLTPMPELLELLAVQTGEPANIFFTNCLMKQRSMRGRPFAELWRSALDSTKELDLKETELEPLRELGSALGRYDTDRQGEAIMVARKRLEGFLQKAEIERDRESKTRTMLGIAAGVMITIILT
jgi:stage III sporulation protein AB